MGEYWRLAANVTVTVSAGRAVFLDIARDRYTMLSPAQNAAFVSWLGERGTPMPAACRSALASRFGLGDEGIVPRRISVAVPCNVIGTGLPEVGAGLSDAIAVARAVIRARRMLRRRSLLANLECRRSALACGPRHGHPRALTLAATYHAVRHLAPARRVCLLDSLALIDWLNDEPGGVQLVFGVTAYPFGAHCWVQTCEALLGDEPDTIGRYAPILHVGG